MSEKITDKQLAHIATASFPFYNDVCKALDPILAKVREEKPTATEALNSSAFGRFFVAIADTFTGLLNTFKTNAFKFLKPLKRSELREFVESNRMKTYTVNHITYDKLADFPVDVPANLEGTYINAVDAVGAVYMRMNALNAAKLALNSFTNIFRGLSSNDPSVIKEVNDINSMLLATVKVTKEAVITCQKCFTGRFSVKVAYKQVFESTKDFESVTDKLLEMEYRLQDANALVQLISKIESTLKGICEVTEDANVNIPAKAILDLGEAAKGLALIFDSYGMAATRQMSLEHNHVLNINNIYAKVR